MDLTYTQVISSTQHQENLGWLIMANRLLALSSPDLQTLLHAEVAANPALELEERPTCPTCGAALREPRCSLCLTAPAYNAGGLDVDEPSSRSPGSRAEDEERDPLAGCAAPLGFKEALITALQMELPAEAAPVIEYLVGNLDEEGYLRCSVEEAAQALHVPLEEVEEVLGHLQASEPSGVGARNLQECLRLQLQALAAQGRAQHYALEIVEQCLEDLARRKYDRIAKQLGITRRQVQEAHAFLKRELTPFPARCYVASHPQMAAPRRDLLEPQVVIRRLPSAGGVRYAVEVVEAERFSLRLSPAYVEAARELRDQPAWQQEAARAHVQEHMGRARLLMMSLRKRWQTLGRITRYLVQQQQAFLEHGARALRPLTRAEVAEALGLHPSTVSRATSDKFVLLPNAQVVPFSTFFEANLPIKEALKDVLAQEHRPLSDQRLAEMLRARGVPVARRTVAKYREELRVPASSRR